MKMNKLFTELYDWSDNITGLSFDIVEYKEENDNIYSLAHFVNDDEYVGYIHFNFFSEENTVEIGEANLSRYSNKGVMTRYVPHIFNTLKNNGIKYAAGTFYSGAITLSEHNGFVSNKINDIGRSILDLENWTSSN